MKKILLFCFSLAIAQFYIAQEMTYHYNSTHGLVENKGQWPEQVVSQTKFDGGKLWVEKHRLAFHFMNYEGHGIFDSSHAHGQGDGKGYVMAMELISPNNTSSTTREFPSKQYFNFFLGNDTKKWWS